MEMPLQGPLKAGLLAAQWYGYVLERYAFPGVLVLSYHGLRPADSAGDLPFANLHIAADVFELARPILRRYRIPAAIFVCSNPVRDQQLFWFDAIARKRGEAAVSDARAGGGAG